MRRAARGCSAGERECFASGRGENDVGGDAIDSDRIDHGSWRGVQGDRVVSEATGDVEIGNDAEREDTDRRLRLRLPHA